MFWIYITVIVISSLFFTILCLLQSSKKENSSGGIIETSGFSQIVGVKKTTDILEKMTLFFSFIIFSFSILTYFSLTPDRKKKIKSVSAGNISNNEENSKDDKN